MWHLWPEIDGRIEPEAPAEAEARVTIQKGVDPVVQILENASQSTSPLKFYFSK